MMIEVPKVSLDVYVAICMVIATPWLYGTYLPFSSSKVTKPFKHQVISTLLLLHSLYMLYELLVSPPQNVFKALGLPVNIPPEYLRAKLVDTFGGEEKVPQYLSTLSKRLGVMELRSLYIRFGHDVLTTCFHCQTTDDFALYAFPTPLLEYIREIAFIGALTLPGSSATHFRPVGLGALLASFLAETYWTLTAQVSIPPFGNEAPVTMWHDIFIQLRHTLFLLLPLLITVLPHLGLHRIPILGAFIPSPPALPPAQFHLIGQQSALPPNITLNQMSSMTFQTLSHLVPTLHLLKYTHAAVMRSQGDLVASTDGDVAPASAAKPSLHSRASQWWAEEAHEGHVVRNDENVLNILKNAGLSPEAAIKEGDVVVQPEGQLMLSARNAVKMLKEQGAKPSEHWLFSGSPP